MVVLFDGKADVPEDLSQQGTHDDLVAMVWNHYYLALGVSEDVVAALAPDPLEASRLNHCGQLPVGGQAKPRQATTSTRQVPTKSGLGSSGAAVLR